VSNENYFEDILYHDSRSPLVNDGWRRLMAGVLLQATKEARKKGDIGACEWLQSDGVEYAAIIGIDIRAITRKAQEWARSPGGAIVIKLVEGQWQR